MVKVLLVFAAICFSGAAFAQGSPKPRVGSKSVVQMKPKAPTGCKLVGTVRGTKLWAGDCARPAPEPAPAAIPPDQKE
jgi:hypothetical protein